MTRFRAELVCEHSLYGVAQELELGAYLRMGHGEEKNGGRERASILADATEAVIAAIFLDGGIEPAASFIERMVLSPDRVLKYHEAGESGPDHDKVFLSEVSLDGEIIGCGSGRTKKEAEQAAACKALERLNK